MRLSLLNRLERIALEIPEAVFDALEAERLEVLELRADERGKMPDPLLAYRYVELQTITDNLRVFEGARAALSASVQVAKAQARARNQA